MHLYWVPEAEAFVRAVAAGSWPVWDRTVAFGQPLLANSSAQVLYPFTWLNLLLRPWWYYTLFVVAHLVLTSAGAYASARRLGCERPGAITAAVLWMACGPVLSLTILWHHFAGAAWLPWLFATAHDLGVKRTARSVLALAGAWGAQVLAGSFEMATMGALTACAVVLAHLSWPRPWSTAADRSLVVRAALAFLLGLGLSAGQWMATAELAVRSTRRLLPRETRTYWSVHPLSAADLVLPGFSASAPLPADVKKNLFENREPFLASLYLGLPSATLVVAALLERGRRRRLLLAGGAALALLIALGRHAPVYDLVVALLPPLQSFRYPVKIMVLVALPWCLLAGIGVDALRREAGGDRRGAIVAWVSAGMALLAAATSVTLASYGAKGGATTLAVAAVLGLITAGAALRRLRPGSARPAAAVIAVVAMADLLLYHRSMNVVAPVELYTHRPAVLESIAPGSRVYAYDYSIGAPATGDAALRRRLSRAPAGWPAEAALALADQMALAPVTAGRWGLLGSFQIDYTGLTPYHSGQAAHLLRATEGTPAFLRLLQMGAVRHVVALHEEPFGDLRPGPVLPGLFEAPVRVYTVPDSMAHTFVAPRTSPGEGIPGLATLVEPGFDFRGQVLIPPGAPPGPAAAAGTTRLVDARPDRLTLDVDVPAGGYVVVLESYDPGWRATIDGAPAAIVPANVIFRGILTPPGVHRIEMAYRPPALIAGLILSAVSAIVMAALAWWTRT